MVRGVIGIIVCVRVRSQYVLPQSLAPNQSESNGHHGAQSVYKLDQLKLNELPRVNSHESAWLYSY